MVSVFHHSSSLFLFIIIILVVQIFGGGGAMLPPFYFDHELDDHRGRRAVAKVIRCSTLIIIEHCSWKNGSGDLKKDYFLFRSCSQMILFGRRRHRRRRRRLYSTRLYQDDDDDCLDSILLMLMVKRQKQARDKNQTPASQCSWLRTSSSSSCLPFPMRLTRLSVPTQLSESTESKNRQTLFKWLLACCVQCRPETDRDLFENCSFAHLIMAIIHHVYWSGHHRHQRDDDTIWTRIHFHRACITVIQAATNATLRSQNKGIREKAKESDSFCSFTQDSSWTRITLVCGKVCLLKSKSNHSPSWDHVNNKRRGLRFVTVESFFPTILLGLTSPPPPLSNKTSQSGNGTTGNLHLQKVQDSPVLDGDGFLNGMLSVLTFSGTRTRNKTKRQEVRLWGLLAVVLG